MLQAESSSALVCLWTGRSLPAAPHPVSRRRSCLQLRTDQCFCPMGTFTPLLAPTLRRTPVVPLGHKPGLSLSSLCDKIPGSVSHLPVQKTQAESYYPFGTSRRVRSCCPVRTRSPSRDSCRESRT